MRDIDVKKIQPTKGYVLVEPVKAEEKTKSGIILSESDSEKPQYGTVLAVGEAECTCDGGCCESFDSCDSCDSCEEDDSCDSEGCCGSCCEEENKSSDKKAECEDEECSCSDEDSCYISACSCSAPVAVGDSVIYKKWGGNEFKIGDTEYQFLKFEDILAVIND